jgi:hypothetical protein
MGICSFQIRNETFFCKVKSKIPDFEREKSRDCAETYIWYDTPVKYAALSHKGISRGRHKPARLA